ncbi:MAG: ribonuclease HII [Clostridiales bacterium]|nr:ribonuclease HII [Clostridiales bacterium]
MAGSPWTSLRRKGLRPLKQDERARLTTLNEIEDALRVRGYKAIAGLDEAGRGPLAGPVVAAAVILPPDTFLQGLNDSKKVSPGKRSRLEAEIKEKAIAWGIGEAGHEEIDELNIVGATKLAMSRALDALAVKPDYLLLDAINLPAGIPQEAIIKGDAKAACISAASILAKTCRDRQMEEWDRLYPAYGFKQHKGYPTAAHRKAVIELGPCPIHRRSFLGFADKAATAKADGRKIMGRQAEDAAAAWLAAGGMRILERNYRCRIGEVDIIGQMGGVLVFVEVRSRSRVDRGLPAESVDYRKRQKLRRVAAWYLQERGRGDSPCRFDVLSLLYGENRSAAQIQWIKDAF